MERLPRKLVAIAASAGVAFLFLGGGGQLATRAAADESVELQPPSARTTHFFGVESRGAVLIGFVNPRGSETTAFFQIGRTRSYGRWFPPPPSEFVWLGTEWHEVDQAVDGLKPKTTYHFRIVAKSDGGTTYGKDMTFRTQPR